MGTGVRSQNGLRLRHLPFYLALAAGLVAALVAAVLAPALVVVAGANAMFLFYLGIALVELPRFDPAYLRRRASDADAPVVAIFAVAILIVIVAVTFLFIALNEAGPLDGVQLVLSIASVILGWFTVNTMASIHYAHEFYEPDPADAVSGGLAFPATREPAGVDFFYFGFAVAMTAQVSDVQVTSPHMRRLVLCHSIFAFFFNTVLVAATVNVIVAVARS